MIFFITRIQITTYVSVPMSSAPKLSTLTPHVLEPGYYWDSRHENDPQPRGDWVRFFDPNNNPPILFEKCSSSNPMEAYTYAAQVKPQDGSPEYQESVVAFCNSHRDKWLHRTSQGDTPSVYHDGIAMPNGMHVDYIWDYLARTIVHEFTHSAVLLQGRKDANGNDINAELGKYA